MRDEVMPLTATSRERGPTEPALVRWTLILLAVGVIGFLVVVPLVNVFYYALSAGPTAYWHYLVSDPDTRHAILLTLTVAPTAVLANVVFGVAAAWAIARFRFPGRTLLVALIDIPFSVSPVVAGLVSVLLFGLQGYLGPWLREHGIKIIFATPGLILVTSFVTLPFVARELIPLMEALGSEEEVAALSLGATGWQMFWRITLPNIRWGLFYGVILCNARAMGEFGAAYVVSGHIAGQTDTMPLRVEKLFQEYNTAGSFAVASLLTFLALLTLVVKGQLQRKTRLKDRDSEPSPSKGEDR
jgi:sulfate transport system permease protein